MVQESNPWHDVGKEALNWIFKVHCFYHFGYLSIFLVVNYLDRFFWYKNSQNIYRGRMQDSYLMHILFNNGAFGWQNNAMENVVYSTILFQIISSLDPLNTTMSLSHLSLRGLLNILNIGNASSKAASKKGHMLHVFLTHLYCLPFSHSENIFIS